MRRRPTIVEVQSTDLSATVIEQTWCGNEAGHAGNGNYMALLLLKHSRKEFFDQYEMRDKVDLEDLVEEHRRCIEDGLSGAYGFGEFGGQFLLVGTQFGHSLPCLEGG